MLERVKDLGGQIAAGASKAAGTVVVSVGEGVSSIAGAAGDAVSATSEKAVRASVDQLCNVLRIAVEQVRSRPLPAPSVTLSASVGLGATSLQMQVVLDDAAVPNLGGELTPPATKPQ